MSVLRLLTTAAAMDGKPLDVDARGAFCVPLETVEPR
jgi:hypothetical protein